MPTSGACCATCCQDRRRPQTAISTASSTAPPTTCRPSWRKRPCAFPSPATASRPLPHCRPPCSSRPSRCSAGRKCRPTGRARTGTTSLWRRWTSAGAARCTGCRPPAARWTTGKGRPGWPIAARPRHGCAVPASCPARSAAWTCATKCRACWASIRALRTAACGCRSTTWASAPRAISAALSPNSAATRRCASSCCRTGARACGWTNSRPGRCRPLCATGSSTRSTCP